MNVNDRHEVSHVCGLQRTCHFAYEVDLIYHLICLQNNEIKGK